MVNSREEVKPRGAGTVTLRPRRRRLPMRRHATRLLFFSVCQVVDGDGAGSCSCTRLKRQQLRTKRHLARCKPLYNLFRRRSAPPSHPRPAASCLTFHLTSSSAVSASSFALCPTVGSEPAWTNCAARRRTAGSAGEAKRSRRVRRGGSEPCARCPWRGCAASAARCRRLGAGKAARAATGPGQSPRRCDGQQSKGHVGRTIAVSMTFS